MKKLFLLAFIFSSLSSFANANGISGCDYDTINYGYGETVKNGENYKLELISGSGDMAYIIEGKVADPLFTMLQTSLQNAEENQYGYKEIAVMYKKDVPVCSTDFFEVELYIAGVVEKDEYYVVEGSVVEASFNAAFYVDKKSSLGGKMTYKDLGLEGKVYILYVNKKGDLIDLYESQSEY